MRRRTDGLVGCFLFSPAPFTSEENSPVVDPKMSDYNYDDDTEVMVEDDDVDLYELLAISAKQDSTGARPRSNRKLQLLRTRSASWS